MKNAIETTRGSTKFLKLSGKPEVIIVKILCNLAKLVKNYPGNTTRLHLIVPRKKALLKEQYG